MYNVRVKRLNEDIKTKQFKQMYLLYGEENYLKRQYKRNLTQALLAVGDTMNYAYYEGKKVAINDVMDLAETMPFFAERRLLVLEDTGLFKSGGGDFAEYLENLPETTYFIFVESEVDKRSKIYKTVKTKGHVEELSFQDQETLKKWIFQLVRKEGKQIETITINHFLHKVGTNMENIISEMEKLFSYTYERDRITKEDVDKVCVTEIGNHVFEMVSAVAEGKQKKALDLYYELLALKEPPMRILFLMTRQYRILLQVKELVKSRYNRQEIAGKIGLPPFVAGKYMDQVRGFKSARLRRILEQGADLEERVKKGLLQDNLAVELFIVENTSINF